MVLIGLAGPAGAQTRAVTGQAGVLAEWDLTATVTEQTTGGWAGPLRLRHVGFCGVDGPEEKTGELRLRVSESRHGIVANMLIDGVACTFRGRLKDGYEGTMHCPDRRAVPMTLLIE